MLAEKLKSTVHPTYINSTITLKSTAIFRTPIENIGRPFVPARPAPEAGSTVEHILAWLEAVRRRVLANNHFQIIARQPCEDFNMTVAAAVLKTAITHEVEAKAILSEIDYVSMDEILFDAGYTDGVEDCLVQINQNPKNLLHSHIQVTFGEGTKIAHALVDGVDHFRITTAQEEHEIIGTKEDFFVVQIGHIFTSAHNEEPH